VLLLNIPPDRRGLIHEIDAERIEAFGNYLAQNFDDNLIDGAAKYWEAHKGDCREFKVRDGAIINTLLLQEDISRGQRVESFKVEAFTNGRWQHLTSGTTIGYKRLLRFSDCRAERIRVTIDECRSTANISNVALYQIENLEDKNRVVVTSEIATDEWKVVGIDSHEAIDDNLTTVWRSEHLTPIIIDLGESIDIAGFCYAPASEGGLGTIFRYNFAVSLDGATWSECITDGEFSNIKHNPIPYYVNFGRSYSARYLRLEPLREIDDNSATSVAELGVLLAR
jgi:alpha-L-fucosidase